MSNTIIIIPARYQSGRFPGKPLALINGHSLLKRTWHIAKAVGNIDEVYIATDDEHIKTHAQSFNAKVIMTPENCNNGTERCYAALSQIDIDADVIINFQGDAVLTPPWILQSLVDSMQQHPRPEIATPAVQLNWQQYDEMHAAKAQGQTTGTLVTFDKNHWALYFSKALIPFLRQKPQTLPPVYQHIGIYAYTQKALTHYLSLSPTPLEQAESLEQLRALENGIKIKVVPVDYRNHSAWSVDNPDDITKVETIIQQQGELVPLS